MTAVRVKNGTLTANTVATVQFAAFYEEVDVSNLLPLGTGQDVIYVTTDASTPSYQGDDCDAVGPGQTITVPNRLPEWDQASGVANPGTTIKLISGVSTTPSYSVEGAE